MQRYQHYGTQITRRGFQQKQTEQLRMQFQPIINDNIRFSGHAYLSIIPGVNQVEVKWVRNILRYVFDFCHVRHQKGHWEYYCCWTAVFRGCNTVFDIITALCA